MQWLCIVHINVLECLQLCLKIGLVTRILACLAEKYYMWLLFVMQCTIGYSEMAVYLALACLCL